MVSYQLNYQLGSDIEQFSTYLHMDVWMKERSEYQYAAPFDIFVPCFRSFYVDLYHRERELTLESQRKKKGVKNFNIVFCPCACVSCIGYQFENRQIYGIYPCSQKSEQSKNA